MHNNRAFLTIVLAGLAVGPAGGSCRSTPGGGRGRGRPARPTGRPPGRCGCCGSRRSRSTAPRACPSWSTPTGSAAPSRGSGSPASGPTCWPPRCPCGPSTALRPRVPHRGGQGGDRLPSCSWPSGCCAATRLAAVGGGRVPRRHPGCGVGRGVLLPGHRRVGDLGHPPACDRSVVLDLSSDRHRRLAEWVGGLDWLARFRVVAAPAGTRAHVVDRDGTVLTGARRPCWCSAACPSRPGPPSPSGWSCGRPAPRPGRRRAPWCRPAPGRRGAGPAAGRPAGAGRAPRPAAGDRRGAARRRRRPRAAGRGGAGRRRRPARALPDRDPATTCARRPPRPSSWFTRNQGTDGRWLYQFDRDANLVMPEPYNVVRHAGAILGLDGGHGRHPRRPESADRGWPGSSARP